VIHPSPTACPSTPGRVRWRGVLAAALLALAPLADAVAAGRSGAEVVAGACVACHRQGEQGAPKIGDTQAWAPRVAQGLSALTAHALQGIRGMPAHGGSPGLSDLEIERAIVHMVNQSGGRWVAPADPAAAGARSGEWVVKAECSKCHQGGVEGAPRIGDRAAWAPRLRVGLDKLVASAVHGHGGMPPRGGAADLGDAELRGAIVYMFNHGIQLPAAAAAPAQAAPASPYHRAVDGLDVYLGVMPAARMAQGPAGGKLPQGKDDYYVNISVFDARSHTAITDAKVTVRVAEPMRAESRTLDPVDVDRWLSYGGYFRMSGTMAYTITAQIQRPGGAGLSEARFEYRLR
jgi:cytochrome c5